MMKKLPKTYTASQLLPLIAHSVRMNVQGTYQPTMLYTMSDDGLILMLSDKKSAFTDYLVFVDVKDRSLYSPHLNTEVEIDETNKTVKIANKEYALIDSLTVADFITQSDTHFIISTMRNKYAEKDNNDTK